MRIELLRLQELRDEAIQALEDTKFACVVACIRAGIDPPEKYVKAEERTLEILRSSL